MATIKINIFDSKSDKIKSYLEFKRDCKLSKINRLVNYDFNINDLEIPF